MSSIIKKVSVLTLPIFILCFLFIQMTKISAEIIVTNVITQTFSYDLQVGSEGQDVYNLQRFLNAYEDTAVAFSGTGSRGYESTYFGGLTKSAVIKFQNKHKIIPADGYVGIETRKKLNELYPTTDFNAPYPPKTTVVTKTVTKTNEINLCEFVELLIAIEAIKPEKASQARSLVAGCAGSNQGIASNKTSTTSSYWTSAPIDYSTAFSTGDYYNNLGGGMSSGLNLSTSSEKKIGDILLEGLSRFAVFAGGSLTNTNNNSSVEVSTPTSTMRTLIYGDVGALTEQAVPLKIIGQNEYNLGVRTQQMSNLSKAIDSLKALPCDYSFSASSTDIGGKILEPGVYCFGGNIEISNPVKFSDPALVKIKPTSTTTGLYVFKTTKNLNVKNLYPATFTSTNKQDIIQLSKPNTGFDKTGLPPYSIFWITDGNVNIDSNLIFRGTIMSKTGYINLGENTDIPEGRVLTRTDITLNKNLIKTPPVPIKISVNMKGDSGGSISGPDGFFCKKPTKVCEHYYAKGDTITLKANPVSSQDPAWIGCDNSKNGIAFGSCSVNLKENKNLTVGFSLDPWGGYISSTSWCPKAKGTMMTVLGSDGGSFVIEKKVPPAGVMAIGTLKDPDETTSCYESDFNKFRIVEEFGFGIE